MNQEETQKAHNTFSSTCFNAVWDLLEKPERSALDEEHMVHLAHASVYHWSQRPDETDTNRSVGYWQLARVYTVLGRATEANRYARLSLAFAQTSPAFYLGYAHEALARVAVLQGDTELAQSQLLAAQEAAARP